MIALADLASETPLAFSVAATGAGALQGALIAGSDDDLDHVGMATLAICLGFGGGIIRDVLLGTFPPTALTDAWFNGVVLAAVVAVSLVERFLTRVESILVLASIVAITVTFVGRLVTFRLGVHTRAARSDPWRR